jgi:DNA primase
MPRISEEEIERIKGEVSVVDLARRRGVELRGHGENLIGLCPFHDDHEPSLVITPAKNLWNCLGACQRGGDVIRWVEVAERVSFRRAIEILSGGYEPAAVPKRLKTADARCPINEAMTDRELVASVVGYYNHMLHASSDARKYLERRGVWSEEAAAHFSIGFADRSLGTLLPSSELKSGREMRERLASAGIYRTDSGREHFNGCITFPVIAREGEVLEIYGRKIRDDVRHRMGSHLYLPGPRRRGIWNGEALTESKEIVVCEAIIDALTFWVLGHRNVIAAFGINGFTDEMFEAMRACGTTRVLVAYDRDEGGDAAAAKLAAQLAAARIASYRVMFPRMMDANDYARSVQPPAQAFAVALRSVEWIAGPKLTAIEIAPPPAAAAVATAPLTIAKNEAAPSLAAEPRVAPIIQAPAAASREIEDPSSIDFARGDRHYRVRGLDRNLSYAQMKTIVRVARGEQVFLDQLDFISARQRANFIKQAAIDIGVKEEIVKNDLASIYRELEVLQEKIIAQTLQPKETMPRLSEDEMRNAMDLLRAPDLIERVIADYDRCGVVGERTNKLVAYMAATSRLLDEPLAIIIQSSTAAGKTKLMDAVLDFMPEEQRIRYSAMTGQSLFYFDGKELKHKILAVSEEEGAERASYALKLLQSEGQLTIASTGKDPQSGRLVTQEYRVEGPVMIFLTTTSIEIDEELLNRCVVLTVDEDREQTRAIHRLQREAETLDGIVAREERYAIMRVHRNAQRLLRPLRVVNPFARALTFVDVRTRTRRDHMKYLTLIRTIALLHQHQRLRKTFEHRDKTIEYIEVEPRDIAIANELAHEVLGRSLDELAPQARRLLAILDREVARECASRVVARCDLRFFQSDVRRWSGWSDYQVKVHLRRLVEMEYLLIHRASRGQSFVYELLYDGGGNDGAPFLPGLIDVARLSTTTKWEHQTSEWEESGRGQVGIEEGRGSTGQTREKASADAPLPRTRVYTLKTASRVEKRTGASYAMTGARNNGGVHA